MEYVVDEVLILNRKNQDFMLRYIDKFQSFLEFVYELWIRICLFCGEIDKFFWII